EPLDRLRDARPCGHAPLLAPPVEPATGQLLDRLVQLLVEAEVEDQLRLARVVREQPDLARSGVRLVLNQIDGQTDELSGDRGVPTGVSPRRPAAQRAARPRSPGPARRRRDRRGRSRWRFGAAPSPLPGPRAWARPRC